jgi:L-lactate dehydrogenase complex protein LldF
MVQPNANAFSSESTKAIANPQLQEALSVLRVQSIPNRLRAANNLPEFEQLRDTARDLKNHILGHLDQYLLQFEAQVKASGGEVHWCSDAESARQTVLRLCREANAKTVTKGKTMIGEEIGINDFLEKNGIEPVETDLGEYIIQLRKEIPSHIIGPALHVTKRQVEETFREHHTDLDANRSLEEPSALMAEARAKMRDRYFEADVGITGANFLIAETGSTVIVTNEGNGDLTQTLPKMHIAITSIEKVVPTLDDAMTLLRLLPRSATGQDLSVYVTFSTGPRRQTDPDGPKAFHVVLLDNGRSGYLGGPMQEMLRCIRCGACMDHCPVYHAVGGHAYGWVYPGPIGSILTPALVGVENAKHLPHASSLCGRCESVCPVRIPIPKLLRHWREEEFTRGITPTVQRSGLGLWAWFAKRPALYRIAARWGTRILRLIGDGRGSVTNLPLAGGWTKHRDFPVPEGKTFHDQWRAQRSTGGAK